MLRNYKKAAAMWHTLTQIEDIAELDKKSFASPQLIFKYSSRCSLSYSMLQAVESDAGKLARHMGLNFLDLIARRDISNYIEEHYGVRHESPQTLLIFKGECVLDQSHLRIKTDELIEVAQPESPKI